MSRIRYLKPGFFHDEDLADCSHLARLLFAGLWTIADREGRLEDRPRRIRAEVLPYEECDTDDLLQELADHGPLILRYSAEGKHYICIPGWGKHQKPHSKEVPSTIPEPTEHDLGSDNARPRQCEDTTQVDTSTASRAPVMGNGQRVTGNGDGDGKELLSDSGESNDASPDDFDLFWTSYPRKESKQTARRSWKRVPKKDRYAATAAAESMHDCVARGWQEKTFCPHPSTFLNQRRWEDWAGGPPPNYLPEQRNVGNLTDVLDAGAQAFGLIGDEHVQLGTAEDADDGPEGTPAGGQDARRRLPACELAAGQ